MQNYKLNLNEANVNNIAGLSNEQTNFGIKSAIRYSITRGRFGKVRRPGMPIRVCSATSLLHTAS